MRVDPVRVIQAELALTYSQPTKKGAAAALDAVLESIVKEVELQ